jgi:hypothetical protein
MSALRHAACILLAAASILASPVYATSFTTDQSDLYYVAEESGWGIQLVQRGSVIFATLFVYDQNGNPTWYTATMAYTANLTWTGTLYTTTNGTYFGSPWNPATLTVTPVGTMTWSAQTVDTGTLTYVVNGVPVTKNVIRQALAFDDYSGIYVGAMHIAITGCTDPSNDTPPGDVPSTLITVTQIGQSITIAISLAGATAVTISGTLSQSGQFGSVLGTYAAPAREVGNASVSAMNVQATALAASFSLSSTNLGCQDTGYFVVMRSQQQPPRSMEISDSVR